MAYKDMFTVLVVDSRIKRSRSLNDAFERILGCLRDRHHLRTDLIGTTQDAVVRLRNDASIGCLLLEWGGKGDDSIDGQRVVQTIEDVGLNVPVFLVVAAGDLERHHQGLLVGVVRGMSIHLVPAAGEASIYLLMFLVLLLRPRGLFGERIEKFE